MPVPTKTATPITLTPYGANLMVKKNVTKKSEGGLLLAPGSETTSAFAVVVSVGPKVMGDIRSGDRIMFPDFAGHTLTAEDLESLTGSTLFNDESDYFLIAEDDVMMVVRG